MKFVLSVIALAISIAHVRAQVVEGTAALPATNTVEVTASPQLAPLRSPSHTEIKLKRTVVRGFLVELAKTNSRMHMLSLRRPVDREHDGKNMVHDPVTRRPMGFKVLSFDF